jgi:hypothetical protein
MSAPPTVPNTADWTVGADMQERGAAAGSMCIRLLIIVGTLPSSIVGVTAASGHQQLLNAKSRPERVRRLRVRPQTNKASRSNVVEDAHRQVSQKRTG